MLGLQASLFLQNLNDGDQPIAIFNSLDESCDLLGDVGIPNCYGRNCIDNLITHVYVY